MHTHKISTAFALACGIVALAIFALAPRETFSQQAGPTCSVTFDQNPIQAGNSTTIRWTSSNADWMYINGIGYVQASGSASVAPAQTTSYNGSAGTNGSSGSQSSGTPGSQTFSAPGSHQFIVPSYGTLTVRVWGGGGGGSSCFVNGGNGGQSRFGSVSSGGGAGAAWNQSVDNSCRGTGGAGGSASGGDTNTSGGNGSGPSPQINGVPNNSGGSGGASPNGGAGGAGGVNSNGLPGAAPGGGGGGAGAAVSTMHGAGGGGGAYSAKTYAAGALEPGSSINVTVGAGGVGADYVQNDGGAGAPGRVEISWTGGGGTTNPVPPAEVSCPATLAVTAAQCTPTYSCSGNSIVNSCDPADVIQCTEGRVCQNAQCVCPAGQTWDGTRCTVQACPSGYQYDPATGLCVAINQCSLPRTCADSTHVLDQCTGNVINCAVQGAGWRCSGGACVPPPPPVLTITAQPSLLPKSQTATISWSSVNTTSCNVTGTNGDGPWNGTAGTNTSSGIINQTTYTLSCLGIDGSTARKTVTINVIPSWQEQ